ncbi:MAG TPA: response regulator [Chloroflexota bacterium]|nr:response regulator [Chloroflexota bacterium]
MPEQTLSATEVGPILLIDDEPYIIRALSFLLTREGYKVMIADNGEDGLERIREFHPPLVFLDIMMPRMNGYEVCKQIRKDPSYADTYVIMLSAKGQRDDREDGLLSGANEYVTKPFSPREIAQKVHALMAQRAAVEHSATGGT